MAVSCERILPFMGPDVAFQMFFPLEFLVTDVTPMGSAPRHKMGLDVTLHMFATSESLLAVWAHIRLHAGMDAHVSRQVTPYHFPANVARGGFVRAHVASQVTSQQPAHLTFV